ncbi:MAG: hypothetical protein JOZ52_08040 [Acidobacteria bacterium]|nr:hypothetical protein [Acidobacteriota bacterium]
MRKLGWHQWVLLSLLMLALFVTVLFSVRAVRRAMYWRSHRDEVIKPWMPVTYVAHSYGVPPHVLYKAINLQPIPHDRRPLREIARQQNRPVETLIDELQTAIVHSRPPYPPPPPPPPPPQDGGASP